MSPKNKPLSAKQRYFLMMLYEKYNAPLFVLAKKYVGHMQDAEDAMQQLWTGMAGCLHVLENKPEEVWLPYLTTVLRNNTICRTPKQTDPPPYYLHLDKISHLLSYEKDPTERQAVLAALRKLSEQEALILLMRYRGFNLAEIAASLDISYEACKKRMQRAVSTLRKLLEDEGIYIERTNL